MNTDSTLSIALQGASERRQWTRADLRALPARFQIPDVGARLPGRRGAAVALQGLIDGMHLPAEIRYVHVASGDGSFTASFELEPLARKGLVLFELDGAALPPSAGGPFRLFVEDAEDCSVNVKCLKEITFAAAPGSHTASCGDRASDG